MRLLIRTRRVNKRSIIDLISSAGTASGRADARERSRELTSDPGGGHGARCAPALRTLARFGLSQSRSVATLAFHHLVALLDQALAFAILALGLLLDVRAFFIGHDGLQGEVHPPDCARGNRIDAFIPATDNRIALLKNGDAEECRVDKRRAIRRCMPRRPRNPVCWCALQARSCFQA